MKIVVFAAALFLSAIAVCKSDLVAINVATTQKTWQSSTYLAWGAYYLVAGLAVDRDTSQDPNTNAQFHCSITNADQNAWWVVDLGEIQTINSVRLTPRYVTLARIANFIVGVSNLSPDQRGPYLGSYPVCAQYNGTPTAAEPITLTCSGAPTGRYLIVQLPTANFLEICELEVFSSPAVPSWYQTGEISSGAWVQIIWRNANASPKVPRLQRNGVNTTVKSSWINLDNFAVILSSCCNFLLTGEE